MSRDRLLDSAGVVGIGVLAALAVVARAALDVPSTLLLGAMVGAVALALVVVRWGPQGLGVGLLVGAAATSPWNAVVVGGLKPGPTLLALALLVLGGLAVLDHRPVRVPTWVWALAAAIAAIALVTLVVPPDASYLATRFTDGRSLSAAQLASVRAANLAEGVQWLVAAAALPVAACLAAPLSPRIPTMLADAWVLGSAVSALVAVTDKIGITHLSLTLLGAVDVGGRLNGLSVQPNHLAVAAAMTLPVAVWRLLRGGRPTLMAIAIVVTVGGLVLSQSRGGLVAAVLAVAVVVLADRRARGALPVLTGLGLAGAAIVGVTVPELVVAQLARLRLVDAQSAAASDAIRSQIGQQALTDFARSPLHGIGLEVAVQGHNIWLQLLAAGGVVLFLGFLLSAVGALSDAYALRFRSAGLSLAAALSLVTWLVVGLVENQLADLFLYVPFAVIAALRVAPEPPPADVVSPDEHRGVFA